jgi:hypothetical protein
MTRALTLHNNFHGTKATIRVINVRNIRKALAKLCGHADCTCGDIRGPQDVAYDACEHMIELAIYAMSTGREIKSVSVADLVGGYNND